MSIELPNVFLTARMEFLEKRVKELEKEVDRLNRIRSLCVPDGRRKNPHKTIAIIVEVVSENFGLPSDEILYKGQMRHVIWARHVVYALSRELTDLSYPALAHTFCKKAHKTIHAAVSRVKDRCIKDLFFRKKIREISIEIHRRLNSKPLFV